LIRDDDFTLLLRGEITSEEYVRRLRERVDKAEIALHARRAAAKARAGKSLSFPDRRRP
jgi:hypothetical protein